MTSRQHDPHVREAILALYSKGLPYLTSPEIIRASCLDATKRLEAVVEAEGGYIEKKLVFWNCKEHI